MGTFCSEGCEYRQIVGASIGWGAAVERAWPPWRFWIDRGTHRWSYALRLGGQSQYCLPDSPMARGRIVHVSRRQRERDNPRYCNGLGGTAQTSFSRPFPNGPVQKAPLAPLYGPIHRSPIDPNPPFAKIASKRPNPRYGSKLRHNSYPR